MALAALLWMTAVVLAAWSVLGMGLLIVARLFRARRDAAVAQSRAAMLRILVQPGADGDGLRAHIRRAAREQALAPIILEVLGVVRGGARASFLSRLTEAGAAEHLRRRLKRGESASRVRVVEALAAFAPREVEHALRTCWRDKDTRVALAAMRASTDIGAPPTLGHVLDYVLNLAKAHQALAKGLVRHVAEVRPRYAAKALARDLPVRIRVALTEALGAAADAGALEALKRVADDPESDVRAAAISALAAFGTPLAFEVIVAALQDKAWPVRVRAAIAAGRLRLSAAIPALRRLRDDENWWVRLRAKEALAALQPAVSERSAA